MRTYVKNSRVILFLIAMHDGYISMKIDIIKLYGYSYVCNFIKKAGIYFKHSFLSETLDKIIYPERLPHLFSNSRSIELFANLYNPVKHSITSYPKKSIFWLTLREFAGVFYSAPLRASGIILSCAISTKFLIEVAFNKKISYLNLSVSIFFLLLGVICFTSRADWVKLKKNSRILKF